MFSLKYILIIAVISYIIYLLTESKIKNENKNIDGYKNYLEIDEDLNKKIMVEYEKIKNDKKRIEKSDKIIPKYLMDLHHDKKMIPEELEKTQKKIYKPLKQNIVSPDYRRYETILSKEFQVDQIKYVKDVPEVKDPGIKKREDEKKDRDKLFDPTKSCKGEWGEWNTEYCGEPSNHCALKTRKYKIIKPEQKGGDSCKFKDGEVQYEYCYGRNNNERCGQSKNLCQCDLSKFDGDPTNCNLETDKNCRCPPGHTFNDVDVTNFVKNAGKLGKDDEDSGEKTRIGYDPSFSLKTGSCRKNSCFCDHGTKAEGVSCKVDGDHSCELTPCNTGHILKGDPPRCYEPKLSSSDGTGTPIEANCPFSKNGSDGKPQVIELPVGSDRDALTSLGKKYIHCGVGETDNCSEGYEKSNDLEKCKAFYGNFEWTLNGDVSPPISCCLPKPGSCEFSEIVGEGKPYRNIFDSDNDLQRLRTMNMNQLRRINYPSGGTPSFEGAQLEDPVVGDNKGACLDFSSSENTDILNGIVLNSNDSKESMVQYIYNNGCDKPLENCISDPSQEDEDNKLCRSNAINSRKGNCFIRGSLENCKSVFSCNNGYKFTPDNPQDKDLLVTKCEENKVPEFNGKCAPEKCDIDPSIRERYEIPRSMNECDNTKGINCGLVDLKCRKDEYIKQDEEIRLECDGNVLRGFGCNEGEIPFAAEADNERYESLNKEKEELENEIKRLRKLKYISQANKATYQNIDNFMVTNIANIYPSGNWSNSDIIPPLIETHKYTGDGGFGNEGESYTSSKLSEDLQFFDEENRLKIGDYTSYFRETNNEYDRVNPPEIFQSQRLRMEALTEIRLDVRISRNNTKLEEINTEISNLNNNRPGN